MLGQKTVQIVFQPLNGKIHAAAMIFVPGHRSGILCKMPPRSTQREKNEAYIQQEKDPLEVKPARGWGVRTGMRSLESLIIQAVHSQREVPPR